MRALSIEIEGGGPLPFIVVAESDVEALWLPCRAAMSTIPDTGEITQLGAGPVPGYPGRIEPRIGKGAVSGIDIGQFGPINRPHDHFVVRLRSGVGRVVDLIKAVLRLNRRRVIL